MVYDEKDFGKLLKKNALAVRRLVLQEETECMRVYDRNLEAFPVSVDLYGKYARITDYSLDGLDEETVNICCDIVRRMCYVQGENVVFHRRSKIGKEQHEILSKQSLLVEVKESGHTFTVDLTKRIDTGLFLDHMRTRQMVEKMSRELRVLNLFSYTGAFSVYAAKGGAKSVDSVDLSSTYTKWAKDNLLKNGFEGGKYNCIAKDALKFIIESVNESCKYDLIVFDPPSFSNSRKMDDKFDVSKDYVRYFNLLNNLLEENGILIFSTNLSSFHMDTGRVKGFEVTQITNDVTAPGFTKAKGTSRTWLLKWTKHVRLQKRDYEGNSVIQKAKESDTKYYQIDKDTIMENLEEDKVEVVETLTNAEQSNEETTTENVVQDEVVVDEATEVAIENIEEDKNNLEQIISELDENEEPSNEDDMLSLSWNDSEVIAPTVRTKSKPKAVTSLADRKNNSRDEDNSDSRDSDRSGRNPERRDSSGGRGDDRRSSGRDNDRDSRRSSGGRDNDRNSRSSYGRDNDRAPKSFGGRDNDRDSRRSSGGRGDSDRDARRAAGGRENDRAPRSSYGRDNDREPRRSFGGRDANRDSRSSYGRDNDRAPGRSFGGRDNDRDSRSSGGRDNDRNSRSSYGRDNDRAPGRSFGGRDNDRDSRSFGGRDTNRDSRSSYGRDNDREPRKPFGGRDDNRDSRSSYGRDNDREPRKSFGGRDTNRDSRSSYGRDNDRAPRSFGNRDNDRSSRSFGNRDDNRDSKSSYGRDNDRGPRKPFGGDSDRRGFRGDDKRTSDHSSNGGARRSGNSPKPYGFDNVKTTRTRGEGESTGFFWLAGNDKKDK